ncbi:MULTISPECIES: tRNA lysidine(34) synthetase TilS [unclassified Clostridioides]|uniref:tRNA lysidine(34) synthetase TilS n=1 Tax=unclassified Clostridioides TaxID=2635829 RepID=UPI001D0C99F0|nr:tRNA lysidine(34) synthetase TilS [Clostridioides sp. ES-S-0001-02]MCC0641251.1 tRNA lysidine(34) synthetase TilS [Clostridioides sp. ES-S-0049-03]MCC0653807.1 tRNA lysidine(34) synthetase TilS [Clostridioides sp. ES-S-0001-03]MCC0658040.1 tRNA lysidine(34) synthetase TilS [Clostridioides sp. ES-S-0123-01]MCC0670987.1 tRNA lysidine(34) synthetase TilS [Clostridioides sp. ES-S-0145-01]MCC0677467.1 tRNA lysidine(34) synthetase TilS [Clostridioides sp. ES-W-0018-02]MCC0681970.1 tRNA lysidine(
MIFDKVLSTINKHNLIQKGDKIVLGLSGGPDSVCLLHVLNRLKKDFNIEIYAAHLNHQIRGIEAQKDALYVSKLCEDMGIVFFVKSINVPKYCENEGLSLEEGARKLRYEMFYEIKDKIKANKIAIGHNLNDQAETVMMRIMRGTGLKGLKGIDYIRDNCIIRPILDVERIDIEEYCKAYNLNPRIDKTNLENIYTRNKIRLDLLPYMKDNFNSNVIESIVRMSNSLKSDNDYIEKEAEAKFREVSNIKEKSFVEINLEDFICLHDAIKVRVLRNSIKHILGDTNFVDQKHIEDIMSLESDSKVNKMITLPRNIFVYRKKDSIILTNEEIVSEEIEFYYNIPSNGFIKIKELKQIIETQVMSIDRYKSMKLDNSSKGFDFNKVKGGIVIRSRRQGDKIKLAMGSKKVKDLFIDLKIPREERCKIPIITDSEGIICVGDYKISENYKIDESTKEVLKINFNKL